MNHERPKCRICGLEDGACICAHLRPYPGSVYTDQPIFDAMAAATSIDIDKRGFARIVLDASRFIEVFNNHRDRALCTSINAVAQVPMRADIAQMIDAGWKTGKSSSEVAEEILREFDASSVSSTLRQCPICARRVASPCETLAIATSCPLSSTNHSGGA